MRQGEKGFSLRLEEERVMRMFLVLFIIARVATLWIGLLENMDYATLALLILLPGLAELSLYQTIRLWHNTIPCPSLSATLVNVVYASLLVTDLETLAAFQRPLDLPLYREATAAMQFSTMLGLFRWYDIAMILLALATLIVRRSFPIPRFPSVRLAAATCLVGAFTLPGNIPGYAAISPLMRIPAVAALHLVEKSTTAIVATSPAKFDPLPAAVPRAMHVGRSAGSNLPNILFVILESTGARYVFEERLTLPKHGVPMPFLLKLKNESLYLARHYATANSSPRALFSLFTGLYPEPSDEFFSLRKTINIKTWHRALPAHRSLVVTPCFIEWYFPQGLLRRNGIDEIIGKNQLRFREKLIEPNDARNEIQTADYFAERLRHLAQPFFAVYISFAPHYPYHDYGSPWHITAGRTRLDHYVNNLRLLDAQLRKFFAALEQRGILQNTVVVLVGDHGEAFRQHPIRDSRGSPIRARA